MLLLNRRVLFDFTPYLNFPVCTYFNLWKGFMTGERGKNFPRAHLGSTADKIFMGEDLILNPRTCTFEYKTIHANTWPSNIESDEMLKYRIHKSFSENSVLTALFFAHWIKICVNLCLHTINSLPFQVK